MSMFITSLAVVALASVLGAAIVTVIAALPLQMLERGSGAGRYVGLGVSDPPRPPSTTRGLPIGPVRAAAGFAT
jgi:hypothetical protein